MFFIVILALFTYGFSSLLEKEVNGVSRTNNGEIVYVGTIDQDKVEKVMTLYEPGDRLIITSSGGDLYAGITLGDFIQQHRMSVEIVDFCISSCANYVFLSGYTKILNPSALVIFHGGPKQANFRSLMQQAYADDNPVNKTFGREGYEAIISTSDVKKKAKLGQDPTQSICGRNEVLNVFGECEEFGPEQRLQYIIYLENELYSRVNPSMDKNIPYYGQLGEYESIYQAYRFFGFYYSLESLAKLNVENVSVKGDWWRPETNPLFRRIYEVEIE